MTNFDGIAESDAIFAQLKTLAGGRVVRSFPDHALIEKNPDGTIKPLIHVGFGRPKVTGSQRGFVSERLQPHILPVTITAAAADEDTANRTAAAVGNRLVGWEIPGGNATELVAKGGRSITRNGADGVPTRREVVSFFETTINMQASL